MQAAISWLAGVLFHTGYPELAEREYLRLQSSGRLSPQDAQNLAHLQVRLSSPAGAETSSEEANMDVASLGKLAVHLPELCLLMEVPPKHDAPISAADIESRMGSSCANFITRLEHMENVTLDDACQLARVFNSIADRGYRNIAHFLRSFPHQRGRAYGRVDSNRCHAVVRGLALHTSEMARFFLLRDRALAGAPEHAGMRSWLELARLAIEARLERDEPHEAGCLVRELQRAAGPLGRLFLLRLEESISLYEGNISRAAELRALTSSTLQFRALELKPWAQWVRDSGARSKVIVHDRSRAGTFESVGPEGERRVWTHATEDVEIELAEADGIEVALSYGLIHPRAGMLLPHDWHLSMGKFPYNHPDVLSRQKGAAILRHGRVSRRVNEPVLLLANMDAQVHRNYYHWIVLILPRILWLHEHGYTKSRRLLLPVEITSWMRQTLEIIGLQDDQLLWYSSDEVLHLESVWLVSPLQFASHSLLHALRRRFWEAAGVDTTVPPRANGLIYLTRDTKNRRPLAQEAQIAASAAESGFDLIDPERLPLLDQVRAFASARAIAGPVGAAFTNILWMQPGGQVLTIFKEEVTLPPFLDLCMVFGHDYRWLLGRVSAGFKSDHVINSPVDVSVPAAVKELRRLAGDDDALVGTESKELKSYHSLQTQACIASGRSGAYASLRTFCGCP